MNLRFFDGKIHPAGASADSALVIPLTLVAQCITMPFGPLVVKAIGARNTLLLGSWMVAAGVYFASYAKDLTSFLLLYSILFGCGAGLGYTAPMVAGWSWLPDLKGLVSGAVLTGYGAGGFFFNLIGTKLVNPNGVDPVNGVFPAEVYQNFPNMLRRLAMIYFGLATFGALLVSEKPVAATPASAATAAIAAAAASKQATKATDKNAKPAVTAAVAAAASVPGLGVLEALGTSQVHTQSICEMKTCRTLKP
jgi:MFS family permease